MIWLMLKRIPTTPGLNRLKLFQQKQNNFMLDSVKKVLGSSDQKLILMVRG